jgi:hypothetical protein
MAPSQRVAPPKASPSNILQDAGVAQLVEQLFRKQQVVRSIRIAGSISILPSTAETKTLAVWQVFFAAPRRSLFSIEL